MSLAKHIPNTLTSCNLLCGCLSIIFAAEGHLLWSAYMIFIGAAFDFGDGLAARALKVQSELGKQLDSLADMVTFGVAPGLLVYFTLSHPYLQGLDWPMNIGNEYLPSSFLPIASKDSLWINLEEGSTPLLLNYLPYLSLIIPVFSAIRLAKFNIDESQETEFKGLATPANALFFAGLIIFFIPILNWPNEGIGVWGLSKTGFISEGMKVDFKIYMVALSAIMSLMLVVPIRMFSFKFKSMGWKGNEVRYLFMVVVLLSILGALLIKNIFIAAPIIILLYIIVSMINNLFRKKNEIQS
ncbi:MAG: CDP-diacylglycerol--serine O-phosphatidyltransferase [Parvicellaceae bacterium]|jgi:CDP-diacylglycerol--serine O-phosphatidyltransferase